MQGSRQLLQVGTNGIAFCFFRDSSWSEERGKREERDSLERPAVEAAAVVPSEVKSKENIIGSRVAAQERTRRRKLMYRLKQKLDASYSTVLDTCKVVCMNHTK